MSELVTGHMERALPLVAEAGVLLHLLLCPACRRYFAQMRVMVRMLRAGPRPPPTPQVESDVLARLSSGGDNHV
jgi:predicted anti-sigma-YlaC factor YlaD